MTERLLRIIWRLYPRGYRKRFSEELMRHIAHDRRAGRLSAFSVLVDALVTLVRSWLHELGFLRAATRDLGASTTQTLRRVARTPAYAVTVVAILSLSIGANTAVFSVTHAVLLRTLPYREPDQVVAVQPTPLVIRQGAWAVDSNFASVVDAAALYVGGGSANLTRDGASEQVSLAQVTPDFFRALGVDPLLGRGFGSEDEDPAVVVLSHRLWVRTFGASPDAPGSAIDLNGRTFRVVGVMPAEVEFPAGVDAWLPFPVVPEFYGGAWGPSAIARLGAGTDLPGLTTILEDRLRRQYADAPADVGPPPPVQVRPLRDELTASVRVPLLVLLGTAGLVMLLGCLNLAGLVLARTAARVDELRVRRALGAGHLRLFGLIQGEVLALAAISGVASLGAAMGVRRLVLAVLPGGVPGLDRAGLNPQVLAFTTGVTVLAGLLVGAIPGVHGALLGGGRRSGGRTATSDRGQFRAQGALVVSQVTLAFVLVTGGGLFTRSLIRLRSVPPGYDLEHVLTFRVRLPHDAYPPAGSAPAAYTAHLADELRNIPGVTQVGVTTRLPLSNQMGVGLSVRPAGTPEEDAISASWVEVTKEYLTAMNIPVQEGTPFSEESTDPTGLDHVVLSQGFAHTLFGDESAAGRTLLVHYFDRTWHQARVDAVVGDLYLRGATAGPTRMILSNLEGRPTSSPGFAVRASGDPAALAARVREVVASVDAFVAPFDLTTTGGSARREIAARRALALLSALFSAAALAVCALGLQGLVAQGVERRRREMGIRLALGALSSTLVRRVATAPLFLVGAGLVFGLPATWTLSGVWKDLLFEVEPMDPTVIVAVVAGVALLALVAAWIPARRIVRVDPAEALRAE